MKTQFVLGTLLAAGLAASMAAQTPTTAQDPQKDQKDQKQTMTVTGCLKRADSSQPAGTSGSTTPSTSSVAGSFILTNVSMGAAGKGTGTGTGTGTSGTSGSTSSASSYRLTGDTKDLEKHVNHRVEIRGTMDEGSPSSATSATGSTATGSPTSAAQNPQNLQAFRVSSVREISGSCSAE